MDDNRVQNAFQSLSPAEQKKAMDTWVNEKAWYLCEHTSTIRTGVRDGYDLSELATHYGIPVRSVQLCAEQFKAGGGVPKTLREENFSNDLPPGAVQGPLKVPGADAPAPAPAPAPVAKAAEVPAETPKKKGRKKKASTASPAPEIAPAPAVTANPINTLHPNAAIAGEVKGAVVKKDPLPLRKPEPPKPDGPFHPKARVNPMDGE